MIEMKMIKKMMRATDLEPPSNPRSTKMVGSNIASSSAPLASGWQSVFMLGDQPLPVTSSVRNQASGQGGRITDSVGQALLLPNDMQYFAEGSDEAVSLKVCLFRGEIGWMENFGEKMGRKTF